MPFKTFSKFPCFLSNICATIFTLRALMNFAWENINTPRIFQLRIFISIAYLTAVFIAFHVFLEYLHKRKGTSRIVRTRRSFQIGFGLITLLGILPYIFYWYYGKGNEANPCLAFFIFNISTTSLFLIFINPYTPEYGLGQNRREKYHKLSLIASILASTILAKGGEWSFGLELQTIWTIANHGFYADFLIAVTDGVRQKDDEIFGQRQVKNQDEQKEEGEISEEFTIDSQELECKVCYRFYSDRIRARAPLVLTYCGHSLCRECCETIRKKENNFYICCPTCRKHTYVKTSANVLPKNEAILAMVRMARERIEGGVE